MGATTRFDAERFAGQWQVVARMGAPEDESARLGEAFVFGKPGAGWTVTQTRVSCNGDECSQYQADRPVRQVAPGRIDVDGAMWWVLWVDDGFRTAAIGTPDGSFGWIMDRKGPQGIGADRLAAAKEIMDWAGYDLTRLQTVQGLLESVQ
ncbi:MAG: lipocalin family protein [Pseudooceanicola sp.]|nr:lipocalin family protein [Pseudooceanicola sp.]